MGDVLLELKSYVVEQEVGRAPLLTIYRGHRKTDNAAVIVKIIDRLISGDEIFIRRFRLITRQVSRLEHPNIAPTTEAEEEGDLLFVAQVLPQARPLADVLETEGPFSPQRMQLIARQIASALDYAHQKSITHGDLSARCIYLTADERVTVTDFGLGQALYGTQALFSLHSSKPGDILAAPETAAPERARGQGPSRQADLYALGILCYQMLAKQPPFTGPPSAVLHAQAYRQPRPLYRVNPGLSIALSEVIARMLSKGVELRYNTGAEFALALSAVCAPPRAPYRDTVRLLTGRAGDTGSRGKLLNLAAGASLILLLTAASLFKTGYELGRRQSHPDYVQQATAPLVWASPTGPAVTALLTPPASLYTATGLPALDVPPLSNGPLLQTATPQFRALSDNLLPSPAPAFTQAPLSDTLRSFSPTPLAAARRTATPQGPTIPVGKGLLVFANPTGHDLVIDLTGPTTASEVVPPNSQKNLILDPGTYQCIVHTVTGEWLATRVLRFDIPDGQKVEKDYYSDYEAIQQ